MNNSDHIQALLGHRDWVRRLALELVGEGARADDITQETLLLAWRRLRRPDGELDSLRAWLAAVVRRMARSERRGDRRRRGREQLAARRESSAAASDSLAELEVQRLLATAVTALPSPAREIVVLRYYDELPPRDIAGQLNLTPKQVHDRLHRALGSLREELRADPRDSHAARFPLPLAGVLLMKPIAIAIAGIAIVALLGWSQRDRLAALTPNEALAPAAAANLAQLDLDELNGEPRPESVERATAAIAIAEPIAAKQAQEEPVVPEPGSTQAIVRILVLNGVDDAPIPGVGVSFYSTGESSWAERRVLTDEHGRAECECPPGGILVYPNRLGISGDMDSASFTLQADEVGAHTFRLAPGGTLAGRVVDYAGRPVSGASIWLGDGNGMPFDGHVVAHSDQSGEFLIGHLSSFQGIAARAPGLAPSVARVPLLGKAEGEVVRLELELPGIGGALSGQLLRSDGTPIPSAFVLVGEELTARRLLKSGPHPEYAPPPIRLRTDEHGYFLAQGLAPGRLRVTARANGQSMTEEVVTIQAGKTTEWSMILPACGSLHGRVLQSDGTPAVGARIELDPDRAHGELARNIATTDSSGEFVIAAASVGSWDLEAELPGQNSGLPLRSIVQVFEGQTTRWTGTLPEASFIVGLVQNEQGQALARFLVRHRPETEDGSTSQSRHTDEQGRFRFPVSPAAVQRVEVRPPGQPFTASVAFAKDVRPGAEPLILIVPKAAIPTGSLSGRLVSANGSPLPGRALELQRLSPSYVGLLVTTELDGTFRIEHIPQGDYSLTAQNPAGGPPWSMQIEGMQAGETRDLGDIRP